MGVMDDKVVLVTGSARYRCSVHAASGCLPDASWDRVAAVATPASIAAFETGAAGCVEYLESVGYTKDAGAIFDIFNAEGDQATLAQICAQVASRVLTTCSQAPILGNS